MSSYYDLASYDAEDERENDPQGPPLLNLCAATVYVGGLLQANQLQYAAMGGFAMVCRGSSRTTTDVDIATDASMRQLWKVIEPEPGQDPSAGPQCDKLMCFRTVLPRLVIPNTKLLDKVIRIFVRTGPTHGDAFCTVDKLVEVDLNVFGGGKNPFDLSHHVDTLEVRLSGHVFQIHVLNLYYMMRTKLRTLTSRGAARDFEDIDLLLTKFGQEVAEVSDQLDFDDRALFVETDHVQSKSPSVIRQYRKLLSL